MCLFVQGAFSVAVKAGVPVVPITLIGTGALMPNGQEGKLYSGEGVRIIVHKPVSPVVPLTASCLSFAALRLGTL